MKKFAIGLIAALYLGGVLAAFAPGDAVCDSHHDLGAEAPVKTADVIDVVVKCHHAQT